MASRRHVTQRCGGRNLRCAGVAAGSKDDSHGFATLNIIKPYQNQTLLLHPCMLPNNLPSLRQYISHVIWAIWHWRKIFGVNVHRAGNLAHDDWRFEWPVGTVCNVIKVKKESCPWRCFHVVPASGLSAMLEVWGGWPCPQESYDFLCWWYILYGIVQEMGPSKIHR